MARLIITSPDGKSGMLEITKPVTTLGRGSANDLVLNDTSVSRFHAVLKMNENKTFTLADRGSTNGVILNGSRIDTETTLKHGDRAKVGIYTLTFEHVDDKGLVVKNADFAPVISEVLRGDAQLSLRHRPVETDTSRTALIEAIQKLEKENYLLTVLYDAGKALNSKLSIDDIAEQVMGLAFRIEGVERGFLMLFDREEKVMRQTEVKVRKKDVPVSEQPSIILSQTILQRLKTDKEPILVTDATSDERFTGSESLRISGLRSAMLAPLIGANRLLGMIYVDNLKRAAAFTQEELNVFALVAAQAAAAIDNAFAHEQLAESAIQRSALERFLSPDVVELISSNPGGVRLGGVNQKATIMFADIRGFTNLSEKMPPEQVVEVLNEYFTRVTDVIFDHGGMLDKYIGDAVMAVFGAPISKGNDGLNAVKAAIEIQRLVAEMNRDAQSRQWPELRVGIGINTGVVTAGNIGSPKRLDYTVIGDTVNTASRLMSNAAPDQIIISVATAGEIGSGFNMTSLPPLKVKGKTEPLAAFDIDWHAQAQKKAAKK